MSHDKLAGLCGRLRCCLAYEHEAYEAGRNDLPKLGKRVTTPDGDGRVKDVNVLQRRVRVELADGRHVDYSADLIVRAEEA